MIDPNRGSSEEDVQRRERESLERMLLQTYEAVRGMGEMFQDIEFHNVTSLTTLAELNQMAAKYSCEPYIILRPREPWTKG